MTPAFAFLSQIDLIPKLLGLPEQFAEAANDRFVTAWRDLGAHRGQRCNSDSVMAELRGDCTSYFADRNCRRCRGT
jgi:hypothetical protein